MHDEHLSNTIAMALAELESAGELVITSTSLPRVADRIAEAALGVVPNTGLSREEMYGDASDFNGSFPPYSVEKVGFSERREISEL